MEVNKYLYIVSQMKSPTYQRDKLHKLLEQDQSKVASVSPHLSTLRRKNQVLFSGEPLTPTAYPIKISDMKTELDHLKTEVNRLIKQGPINALPEKEKKTVQGKSNGHQGDRTIKKKFKFIDKGDKNNLCQNKGVASCDRSEKTFESNQKKTRLFQPTQEFLNFLKNSSVLKFNRLKSQLKKLKPEGEQAQKVFVETKKLVQSDIVILLKQNEKLQDTLESNIQKMQIYKKDKEESGSTISKLQFIIKKLEQQINLKNTQLIKFKNLKLTAKTQGVQTYNLFPQTQKYVKSSNLNKYMPRNNSVSKFNSITFSIPKNNITDIALQNQKLLQQIKYQQENNQILRNELKKKDKKYGNQSSRLKQMEKTMTEMQIQIDHQNQLLEFYGEEQIKRQAISLNKKYSIYRI